MHRVDVLETLERGRHVEGREKETLAKFLYPLEDHLSRKISPSIRRHGTHAWDTSSIVQRSTPSSMHTLSNLFIRTAGHELPRNFLTKVVEGLR